MNVSESDINNMKLYCSVLNWIHFHALVGFVKFPRHTHRVAKPNSIETTAHAHKSGQFLWLNVLASQSHDFTSIADILLHFHHY